MANKKFTDLLPADALPTLTGTDILAVTVDPNGATPVSNKTTIANLMGQAPVQSVNTATGAVVLDADDIDDSSTTHKFVTASDITNLSNLSGTNTGDQDLSALATQVSLSSTESNLTSLINLRATQVSLGNHESLTSAVHGISAFGATLVDDVDAATARSTLGVDAAGTDNSTNVTLATVPNNYLSLSGQEITAGVVPVSLGGTGASDLTTARANLGLGTAATTDSTDYATAAQGTLADSALQSVSAGDLTDGNFDGEAILGFKASLPTEITAATYTVQDSDNGQVIRVNHATGCTVTIPSGLFTTDSTGFNCSFIQVGAGQITFANDGTSVINNRQSHTKTNAQWAAASVVSTANNVFVLAGDTAS